MRLLLDTNVWSYFADHDAGADLARVARTAGAQIVVSPAIVDELRALPSAAVRKRALRLVARKDWARLMPESYAECAEVKAEIQRLRPEWLLPNPRLAEVNRLRYDWVRRTGGFWDRAGQDVAPLETDESKRGDRELRLAREESYNIRKRLSTLKAQAGETHLQNVAGVPNNGTPGWDGSPVPYWRVPSLHFFRSELLIFASPVREWLDSEIDVAAMLTNLTSMNRLWLHEMNSKAVPRQWLRGAFEFLQAWHKVTDGTPNDSRLATHLMEVDRFITADRNFARFAERCSVEAPFPTAVAYRVPGSRAGVDETLSIVAAAK
jgi:hypothetical protein